MDVWKYEIISKRTSEISCSTREIISYIQTSIYCSVHYIKKVLLSHKNRAVYSNAFHDNRHIDIIYYYIYIYIYIQSKPLMCRYTVINGDFV